MLHQWATDIEADYQCEYRIADSLTIISMGLQRDVPQYMAMPWFITWVMARTVSAANKTQAVLNCLHHSHVFTDKHFLSSLSTVSLQGSVVRMHTSCLW